MHTSSRTQRPHIAYFDYLRLFATLGVILAHVSGQNISSVEPLSYPWIVFFSFDALCLWTVPAFIMISGALFLDPDKDLDIRRLYRVHIFRLVTVFFFWSFIYALEKYLKYHDIRMALTMFFEGRYHMWYLLMTAGLYIVAPILRSITQSKKATEYFLITAFFFTFLIPELLRLLEWINLPHTAWLIPILRQNVSVMCFPFTITHTFYFVLGFYLHKYALRPQTVKAGYIAGIVGYISLLAAKIFYIYTTGADTCPMTFSLNGLVMTAGVFLFAKYALSAMTLTEKTQTRFRTLSRYTFGAYLVHALVLSQLRDQLQFTTLSFDPLVSVILLEVCTVLLSFGISIILNRIPYLKKYIV